MVLLALYLIYVTGFHFSPTGLISARWPLPAFTKPLAFTAHLEAKDKSVGGLHLMVYLTEANGKS
jgi:hypothetical protein